MAVDPKAIEPGSTEFGDRAGLEQGLVAANQAAGGGPAGVAPPTTAVPSGGNAISDMLSGAIKTDSGLPLTDGLGVGPGQGPASQQTAGPLDSDLATKLKMLASQASSPALRLLALNQLKRIHRGRTID